jgi:hypothetical protein
MTAVATFPDDILKQLIGDDYEMEHWQYVPKLLFFDFSDEAAYMLTQFDLLRSAAFIHFPFAKCRTISSL